MTQRDLNRAVAKATGESVGEIAHMGFSELPAPAPGPGSQDDRTEPAVLDWDALDELLASEDPDTEPPLLLVA